MAVAAPPVGAVAARARFNQARRRIRAGCGTGLIPARAEHRSYPPAEAGLGDDHVHRHVERLRMDGRDFLKREPDADRQRPRVQRAQGAVEIAATVAEPVAVWVETDGTVYWSTAENVIPTHGDGGDRDDNKYIDNSRTYHSVIKTNSIGVEFIGNYPDVTKPVTPAQAQAWLLLAPFLQERYGIPPEHIYAHNWIDFKDQRYCEGCELATLARKLGYCPSNYSAEVH